MPMFLKMKKVIKLPESNMDWFSDNFLKANPNKCQLSVDTDEIFTLKIKNSLS